MFSQLVSFKEQKRIDVLARQIKEVETNNEETDSDTESKNIDQDQKFNETSM